jgi:hypothetical protein
MSDPPGPIDEKKCSWNVAKYDLPRSLRRTVNYSGPDSAFFRIMTSGIWKVREKRYNGAFYGLRNRDGN